MSYFTSIFQFVECKKVPVVSESKSVGTFLRLPHAWASQTFPSPGFTGHPEPYWYTIGDESIYCPNRLNSGEGGPEVARGGGKTRSTD